jgi:hypothetical protein
MADKDLARVLREFMVVYDMPEKVIDALIAGSIMESEIEKHICPYLQFIYNHKTEFASDLGDALVPLDAAMKDDAYDFSALGLDLTKKAAEEDLSAIHNYARTARFDACKAVTNILRIIKVGERGRLS